MIIIRATRSTLPMTLPAGNTNRFVQVRLLNLKLQS